MIEIAQANRNSGVSGAWGKPTSSTIPAKPMTSPMMLRSFSRSSPAMRPTTMENSGMAETMIAVMAVPILGAAKAMPASCITTVRKPEIASGFHPQPKSSRRRMRRATSSSAPPAVSARKLTVPAQPKAATTRTSTMKDNPHTSASTA